VDFPRGKSTADKENPHPPPENPQSGKSTCNPENPQRIKKALPFTHR
jgi:hypothetical protein